MKLLIKSVVTIGVLAVGVFTLNYFGFLPNQFNPFNKSEVKYQQTALQVEDVKAVAKLFTQQYVNEIIIVKKYKDKGIFTDSEDKLVIIAQGTCFAGTDLSKMKQEDIKIIDSVSCEITIPHAEILESTINPSGFRTFISEGYWENNFKMVQKVKTQAVKRLENLAKSSNILKKADKKSISIMKSFMQSIGFKNTNVIIK